MTNKSFMMFILVSLIFLYSCEPINTDEEKAVVASRENSYAGVWYTDYDNPEYTSAFLIYDLTDTSFTITIFLFGSISVEVGRGNLTQISDTVVLYDLTHEYSEEEGRLLEVNIDARDVIYNLSEDETTLVFDNIEFSSGDPR